MSAEEDTPLIEDSDDRELSDEERVRVMLNALQSPQLIIRSTATNQLVELGKRRPDLALDPLIKALDDDFWAVKFGAAEALGEIGNPKAVPPLVEHMLQDEDPDFRAKIAEQLGILGSKDAIPGLIKALKDDFSETRENAAKSLGMLKAEQAVDALNELLLKDPSPYVRRQIAWALGEIGDNKSVSFLIKTLKDKDGVTREKAAEALGKIKDPQAIVPLASSLGDSRPETHLAIVTALSQFDAATIVKSVLETFGKEKLFDAIGILRKISFNIEQEELNREVRRIMDPIITKYQTKLKKHTSILKTAEAFLADSLAELKNIRAALEQLPPDVAEQRRVLKQHYDKVDELIAHSVDLGTKVASLSFTEFTQVPWIKEELFFDLDRVQRMKKELSTKFTEFREICRNIQAQIKEKEKELTTE